ncbi:MFS transporter [Amycolatopsis acidicola]|uniref:MFS transporter n=1 Tax=Amycolatopsis acidicola TaxID=2596893 RepID=UPI001AA055C9|nr:MFS transporter [Amycolatopsis acidicola]
MTVLPVVLTATFMQLLDVTIAQVAIPSIRAGLHAGPGTLQLVLAGYTLAYACLLITAARLGDRFGYRRLFVLGLVVFTLASAACAAAPTASVLVAARVVQGAGSGLMAPQVFSIIQTALPASQRPRALSFLGATMGIASLSGPVLGALLLGLGGWRLLFLVNVPVSLLALAGAGRLPKTRPPSAPKVDAPGAALAMAGLGLLVFPLSVGRELHWPLWTFGCFAAAVVLLLLFARSQARGREPLLHPSVLRDRRPVRGGRDPRQPHRATDRPQVRIPAPDRRGRHARPGHGCLGLARHSVDTAAGPRRRGVRPVHRLGLFPGTGRSAP